MGKFLEYRDPLESERGQNHDEDISAEEQRNLSYFELSSFGIFHVDSCFRRGLLKLTETKDAYNELIDLRKVVNEEQTA